jgi:hypothetical protein
MLRKWLFLSLVVLPIAGMDKQYTKNYVVADLSPIVEHNISDMKKALNAMYYDPTGAARHSIRYVGKKRGATELELDALEQFNIINYWNAQTDFKTYVQQLNDDVVDKLLKEIDNLITNNVDDVVTFQNAHYKVETKETAFKRLIQSAHFNKKHNRAL